MAQPLRTEMIAVAPDVADLIREAVTSGAYASPSDAIRDAFRERRARMDDLLGLAPEEVCRLWDEGLASGPGRSLSLEEIERQALHQAGQPMS